jgi:hypothetical protein
MVFSSSASEPFAKTGTTSPIFVAGEPESQLVQPGEYFWIKVHSAQAAFRGSIFEKAKQLVITSRVNLHHAALGNEEVYAIQRSRAVKKNQAEQLGLSPNLVSLVPATMSHVSVSIEFLLDKENHLAKLGPLINSDTFLSVVSLAPGAAAVAKTVGGLAQGILQTFVPAEERTPILQFSGDLNVGGDVGGGVGMRDGYYAILGSRHEKDPLPDPFPKLEVREDTLLADGKAVSQWSYVVLQVTRVPARTRAMNEGALWDAKLREAEAIAQEVADDPFADDDEKREKWAKVKALLQEARILLQADPNYAAGEADAIYKTVYKWCADTIAGRKPGEEPPVPKAMLAFDTKADRVGLDIAEDEDLDAVVAEYTKLAAESMSVLKASGLF